MYFQKVIKGIHGLDKEEIEEMLKRGILCNFFSNAGQITMDKIKQLLIEENIDLHLSKHHKPLPSSHPYASSGKTYGDVTPFISTTAGMVVRNDEYEVQVIRSPFMIALQFATKNFTTQGTVFFAYVMTLGKPAVELQQFSEEVRDVLQYTDYKKYLHEGEIMAKIVIPSVQIEKAWVFDGPAAKKEFDKGQMPTPIKTYDNADYLPPEKYSNIRELLSK
jgi:hypothetical protein